MNMEYRIGRRMRIFVFISSAIFGLLGIAMFIGAINGGSGKDTALFLVMGIFFLCFSTFFLLSVLRTRLVIDDQAVTAYYVFIKRTLLLKDIAGYRAVSSYLVLVPKSRRKVIKV